jgi:membrane fusion protein
MSDPIFRKQATDAMATNWAGTIVLARPVPMRVAAAVGVVLAVLIGLLLTLGEYTRKVGVSGQIVPSSGSIKVVAYQLGRITSRHVEDGASVMLGQPLFDLTAERTGVGVGIDARISNLLAERRTQLFESSQLQVDDLAQRARGLAIRQRSVEADVANRKAQVELQNTQVHSAKNKLIRYKTLAQQGFVSQALLGDTKDALIAQIARRVALESEVITARRELLQIEEEAKAINNRDKQIKSQTALQIASIGQEAAEHDGRTHMQVLAPAAGIITALAFETGQTVPGGAPLATILPNGSELEARLFVPSRAVGFVEPGQLVRLRLSAFAYQKFGQIDGRVVRVELSPIAENQAGRNAEPVYRVTVQLSKQAVSAYGRTQQFKAGMTLEADILQERRRLIEWLVDPLISAAKNSVG